MSQRRFSRGVSDNDLTLEQRLVMQLSAAMRHDEQVPEEPAVSTPNPTELEHPPSNERFRQHNEPTDWPHLLGSLSSALGNPPPANHDAQGTVNKTVVPPTVPNHTPINKQLDQSSSMTNNPINQPQIDFSNLDLSGLGNLRLSDLGILSNLGNLWDNHGTDANGQGNHMVDANNLLQTLGTLSHIGNLANQASHGNLESLGSLGNLANLGSLGGLGRLNHQPFDYSATVPPDMSVNPPHTGIHSGPPLPAGQPSSVPTSAHGLLLPDSSTSIAHMGSSLGSAPSVPPQGSHEKAGEPSHGLPSHPHDKSPFHSSLAVPTDVTSSPMMGKVPNYTHMPQLPVSSYIPSSNLGAHANMTNPAGASLETPRASARLGATSQLPERFSTAEGVSESPASLANPSYNSGQHEPPITSSTAGQSQLEDRPTPTFRSAIESRRDSFRSRESLLSLHEHIPTAIDPEVSSIQSVLQSLLTGGTVPGLDDSSEPAPRVASLRPESPPPPTINVATNSTEVVSPTMAFGNLSELGLGAEDQALIESLRSVISLPSNDTAPNTAISSSASDQYSRATHTSRLPRASADFSERTSRPRAAGAVTKYRKTKPPSRTELEPRPAEASSSEFNASDTDTLRAIQQALLSAMGPMASSTSLAESLTSTAAAHSAAAAAQSELSSKSPPDDSLSADSSAAPSPVSSTSLLPGEAPSKAGDTRISKPSSQKKPVSKVIKPSEIDKQKVRDENAARKRKWREVHLVQNKDNDLRLRIMKRANEIYGSDVSDKKNQWITEEFERRRQRRIFRAGINSIVDAARARAAKAAENGEPARTPLEYARMHISDHARTLTQQSKQAAKSRLSQLFRSSNAALGPQLHKEKVPLPMAAYMLVSSPRRPPYKIAKTPIDMNTKDQDKRQNSNTRNAESTQGPQSITVSAANSPSEKSQEISEKGDHTKKGSESLRDDEKRDLETRSGTENEAKATDDQQMHGPQLIFKDHDSTVLDMRPKHRYGLVGNLKLGVPPNLSAIYHKIRGTNPFDHKTRLSAQNS